MLGVGLVAMLPVALLAMLDDGLVATLPVVLSTMPEVELFVTVLATLFVGPVVTLSFIPLFAPISSGTQRAEAARYRHCRSIMFIRSIPLRRKRDSRGYR